ncbi:hypothetical protein HMP06_0397 [Sphingomonas sp. HMP6]|nr:hypothetical protein HMP06_0397 [Sphingomonas sp. HMP6]
MTAATTAVSIGGTTAAIIAIMAAIMAGIAGVALEQPSQLPRPVAASPSRDGLLPLIDQPGATHRAPLPASSKNAIGQM